MFLIVVPFSLLVFKVTSKRFRTISSRIQESVGDLTHIARQSFHSHRLVKIFGAHAHEESVFFAANNRNRQQSMKISATLAAVVPLLVFVMGVALAGVIWLALALEIKPGAFTSYLIAMTMIVRPVKNLSRINETIQAGLAGAESVFRTLDLELEADQGTQVLDRPAGAVSFEEVSFRYREAGAPILDRVSFDIPPGATVAAVFPRPAEPPVRPGRASLYRDRFEHSAD